MATPTFEYFVRRGSPDPADMRDRMSPFFSTVPLAQWRRGDLRSTACAGSGDPRTTSRDPHTTAFAEMIQQAKFFRQRSSRQLLTKLAFAPQDLRHLECHDPPRWIRCLWSAFRRPQWNQQNRRPVNRWRRAKRSIPATPPRPLFTTERFGVRSGIRLLGVLRRLERFAACPDSSRLWRESGCIARPRWQ